MKHKTTYSDQALGKLEIVDDFLPSPDQLVMKEDGVKVTLSLSKRSVEFFKIHAQKSKVPYQKMIRNLLDSYASKYAGHTVSKRPGGRRSA
jgi:predicted DNA binding CopG/RHH family protein